MSQMPQAAPAGVARKRCFVVMGFGEKTDYATGRKLDLNKSYRLLIKPAVEECGLQCVRADEIRHSGVIDVPMYHELFAADVVVADLSTANPNALYELGVRHALRPRSTIVISENKLPYPFDLNHIKITSYTHLGDAIDYEEVLRFRAELEESIKAVLNDDQPDSPIYNFLSLTPPALLKQAAQGVREVAAQITEAAKQQVVGEPAAKAPPNPTLAMLVEQGEKAIDDSNFAQAKLLFEAALQLTKTNTPAAAGVGAAATHTCEDPYLVHRLVLATYNAKMPDEVTALNAALTRLEGLDLRHSNDPETVGLAGAIHKRLFDQKQGDEHLHRAVNYYARGFFLSPNFYNGINLAYLLNVRTDSSLDPSNAEKIADLVWANRIRREVVQLCEENLQQIREREKRTAAQPDDPLANEQRGEDRLQKFWALATLAEAYLGLGQMDKYEQARAAAAGIAAAEWRMSTFNTQVARLRALLEKYRHLLDPPWPAAPAKRAPPSGA